MNCFLIRKDFVNECCIAIDFSSDPSVCSGTIQITFSCYVESRARLMAVMEYCASVLQTGL